MTYLIAAKICPRKRSLTCTLREGENPIVIRNEKNLSKLMVSI